MSIEQQLRDNLSAAAEALIVPEPKLTPKIARAGWWRSWSRHRHGGSGSGAGARDTCPPSLARPGCPHRLSGCHWFDRRRSNLTTNHHGDVDDVCKT